MLPRHPMTKGRIRLSPWNPIEQRAFLLPPLHPHRPTLRGLDERQPHRGWIATGEISAVPGAPSGEGLNKPFLGYCVVWFLGFCAACVLLFGLYVMFLSLKT